MVANVSINKFRLFLIYNKLKPLINTDRMNLINSYINNPCESVAKKTL